VARIITRVYDCRLIIDPPASGPRNMAVDEALLIDTAEHNSATLRFYSWIEPTLSLGYFQRYTDREQHAASRECAVVRRQTGGGAILHDRELTYSLALPPSHPLTKQNEKLYRIVHEVFIDVLSPLDPYPDSVRSLRIRGPGTKIPRSDEPFLCFQRQSPGDVIFISADTTPTSDAALSQVPASSLTTKIIGSAQRRYHGAVLQHGSLLLERSPAAPELEGWNDIADLNVAANTLISKVADRVTQTLKLDLHESKLPLELESNAAQIANSKYGSSAWTKRR
jgi:lipoate-protein ligase A